MAEDAFVTDFEHIMADDITENVRFIMYDSESGKTASAGEVSKYMMKSIHVDTTLTEEGAAADAKAVGEALATKADTKGRYEDIVAGGAEQLMADGHESDTEPYLFRPTGGSADVGNREYLDKIVGGTVAWNQLAYNGNFADGVNGWKIYDTSKGQASVSDGILTLEYSAEGQGGYTYGLRPVEFPAIQTNHKYFIRCDAKADFACSLDVEVGTGIGALKPLPLNSWESVAWITQRPSWSQSNTFAIKPANATIVIGSKLQFKNIMVIDLTALFNPTIADYIYSLEQSSAGAGVAWFRNYFPKDYYSYDKGTLRSVEGVSAHETVGFNQWDEEWEQGRINIATGSDITGNGIRSKNYTPVLPSTNYYAQRGSYAGAGGIVICYYDGDKNFISYANLKGTTSNFTTLSNARYIRLNIQTSTAATYNHDICINLSDPTRNGEYEPYTKHTYPLDSSLTLRGVPKLVDGKLAFDGDIYPPSGEVQRRYGTATFNGSSSESWSKSSSALNGFYISMSALGMKEYGTVVNSYGYPQTFGINDYYNNYGRAYTDYTFCINIDPSLCGSTVESFKTYLASHPITIVYELATPTTETADGYEHYQICDTSGTEAFVTDSIVPVGHETRYPHDLKKKIETAPDSPSTDGTYLMKRSGGKNAYMALPSTPSANGSYVLTVTVSGGSASYSWTAKE